MVNPMVKQFLFLLFFFSSFVATLSSANNSDNGFDSDDHFWSLREKQAEIRNRLAYHAEPFNVTNQINLRARMTLAKLGLGTNSTRRFLTKKYNGPCIATNPIDSCWRCRSDWQRNRKRLAKCVLGFGSGTIGGMKGKKYVVTDPSDHDLVNPKPGTLRHAVIQKEPLWIVFARSMYIKLQEELIMASHKTIDGRGADVIIADGGGITIQFVENIIIHGIKFKHILSGQGGLIRDSVNHFGMRSKSDGDAISVFGSHHIWIDHCSLTNATDGLIDVIQGSTAITISNCHFTKHHMALLFGAKDTYTGDKIMQITLAYNHFGKKLEQRMPRCRFGFFHLVNNDYTHWEMYAIGGSNKPTIISQGNRYVAPPKNKRITHRVTGSVQSSGTWRSEGDMMVNGAYFVQSGEPLKNNPHKKKMIPAMPGTHAAEMTRFAGPLKCIKNRPC